MIEHYINIQSGADAAPTDPPSFADPVVLYRSDAGMTLVNELLDSWADQSGNGVDASAATTSNRIGLIANKGVYGFKDLQQWAKYNFYSTNLPPITNITEYTFDIVIKIWNTHNPLLYGPMVGDVNYTDYPLFTSFGTTVGFAIKKGGVTSVITYTASDFPSGVIVGQTLKLTVVYDGAGATNNDKFKLYRDGILVGGAAFAGAAMPTSVSSSGNRFSVSSSSVSRTSYFNIGYIGYWERALTSTEITENNDWKNQIWD